MRVLDISFLEGFHSRKEMPHMPFQRQRSQLQRGKIYMPKIWTKNFLIITLANFFVYVTHYILMSTVVIYAIDKFQASSSMAGLSAGIFIIGAIVGRLFAGSAIEHIGYKKMLYWGLGFSLITTLLYFAVSNLLFLIGVRLFHGLAFGLTTTATGVVAAEMVPNERRGEGTGYYALSTTLALAIGPFIGMILIQHANFNANLIACAIIVGTSFLAVFSLRFSKDKLLNKEPSSAEGFKLSNYFEAKALPISIVAALICFEYSCVLSFLSSYTKSINLMEAGSFFFIAYSVASITSRPL